MPQIKDLAKQITKVVTSFKKKPEVDLEKIINIRTNNKAASELSKLLKSEKVK